jgi:prepilin-type N-terminal cleavage/methylation domain-containing protein
MKKKKTIQGISLLEILVVITVFSILAVLSTRAVFLTLRGSRRSESSIKVRGNVDYSLAVIERNLRNAESIVECPNTDTSIISYLDEDGVSTSFSCGTDSDGGYIASASGRLTSSEVDITNCSFVCEDDSGGAPPAVTVSIEAQETGASVLESGKVTISTKIFLRTY